MRKGSLLLVALLVLTTGAFAEITGVGEPSVSGSVEVTFGYDLDNEGMGFVNDDSISLTLPLLDGSAGASGDDGIYGEITVDGIGWNLNNDGFYDADEDADAPDATELDVSISAKLYINDLFVGLGNPGFDFNNVDIDDSYPTDVNPDASSATGGISVGYMSDMFTVELLVATEGDYRLTGDDGVTAGDVGTDDDAAVFDNDVWPDDETASDTYVTNVDANMVFGAVVSVSPAEGVSIPINFVYDADYSGSDALIGFGMAPSIAAGMATISIPFDYASIGDITGMEADPTVSLAVMENLAVALDFLYASYENVTITESPNGAPGDNAVADLTLTVTDSGQFVPGLANTLAVSAGNLLDYDGSGDVSWDLDVDSSFTTNGMKPYVNFGYGSNENFDLGLGVVLMAEATGLDNTTVTLDYTNDALADATATESGRVTLNVKVAF